MSNSVKNFLTSFAAGFLFIFPFGLLMTYPIVEKYLKIEEFKATDWIWVALGGICGQAVQLFCIYIATMICVGGC